MTGLINENFGVFKRKSQQTREKFVAENFELYDKTEMTAQSESIRELTFSPSKSVFHVESNNGNGKMELRGFGEHTISCHTTGLVTRKTSLYLAKDILNPMLDRFQLAVDQFNAGAVYIDKKNESFESQRCIGKVANKVNGLHDEIMTNMDVLLDDLISFDFISYELILEALKNSQKAINIAQKDGGFDVHHSLLRNAPHLHVIVMCIDLLMNILRCLEQKFQKALNHDSSPVFNDWHSFKCGMFKPQKTAATCLVEALNDDMNWYIHHIEREYQRIHPQF